MLEEVGEVGELRGGREGGDRGEPLVRGQTGPDEVEV